MSVEYDELNPGQSFDALEAENARLRELLKMSSDASFEIAADIARKSEAEIRTLRGAMSIDKLIEIIHQTIRPDQRDGDEAIFSSGYGSGAIIINMRNLAKAIRDYANETQ